MKRKQVLSFLISHKKYLFIFLPVFLCLFFIASTLIVQASWGTWGNSSLIHACKDTRGRVTIVSSSDSCNQNETQVTWLKDVEAGDGLTISRDSSGATLSLENTATDGWTPANETWTYASSDDPTFTFTISGDQTAKYSLGMRVKFTQTTVKYFLITKVSYSSPNTTITVYGGTDYDLADAAISSPSYSMAKAPHGFPLNPDKWTVITINSSNLTQANPTSGTWYNLGNLSISIPIGIWEVSYSTLAYAARSSGGLDQYVTLSTANNSESDIEFTSNMYGSSLAELESLTAKSKIISVTSETDYYLNTKTAQTGVNSIAFIGTQTPTILKAVCVYL